MSPAEDRFDVQPNVSNHFAWMRTQLALQRTMLAAVRTAVSLIGFGFTVAQFFDKLVQSGGPGGRLGPEAPRNMGLILIAAGVVSLMVFAWQYRVAIVYLRTPPFDALAADKQLNASTYIVTFAVLLIGVVAFVSVLFRF